MFDALLARNKKDGRVGKLLTKPTKVYYCGYSIKFDKDHVIIKV